MLFSWTIHFSRQYTFPEYPHMLLSAVQVFGSGCVENTQYCSSTPVQLHDHVKPSLLRSEYAHKNSDLPHQLATLRHSGWPALPSFLQMSVSPTSHLYAQWAPAWCRDLRHALAHKDSTPAAGGDWYQFLDTLLHSCCASN